MKINVIMTAMFMTMVGPVGSLRAMNPIAPKKVEVITSTMLNNEVEKALLKSAEAGDKDSVEKALKASADVNVCDQNGMTALHLAARNGHDNIVALLLNKGAEVDIETDKGSTALTLAFYWSHDKVVIQLLEHGAHIEEQTWRSYFSGAINSRIYLSDAIKKHLKKQSDHLKKCLKKELLEKRRKEIEKALFDDRAGNEKENIGSILPSEGGHRAGLGGLIGEYESLPEYLTSTRLLNGKLCLKN
ncbi:MAG: ankyrin repeat domain-containing protein [Candidatus Dependentiae bacterium]|nr:ankyrin repeat domain-containing protein [Candidatus Dependentiae bacterium]